MNAGLLILRVASDAQNERDGAGLHSSVAAATPSQQQASDSVAAPSQQHYNLAHSTGRLRRVFRTH